MACKVIIMVMMRPTGNEAGSCTSSLVCSDARGARARSLGSEENNADKIIVQPRHRTVRRAFSRGGRAMPRAFGHKEGTFLYEEERLRSCGLPKVRVKRGTPRSVADTVKWARRIPRAAREAQGFTRIADFARHVKRLRAKRAELRKQHPDPVRRAILDKLERIMFYRTDLRKAARRKAKANCHPDFPVWWSGSKPRLYTGIRLERHAYYPKRNVAVPAKWVLARLGGRGANVAVRVRRADPLRRIFSTPGWIERVAAGDLRCHPSWLTDKQRARVAARAADISHRKRLQLEKRQAEWQRATAPAPDAPDTLGWRGWNWNGRRARLTDAAHALARGQSPRRAVVGQRCSARRSWHPRTSDAVRLASR